MKSFFNTDGDRLNTPTSLTNQPPALGNFNSVAMEFGRARDVQNVSGIKRGLLHCLVAEGKIKSVLIRRKGNVHGTRYYYMPSVLAYLHSLMDQQNPIKPNNE